MAKNLVIVESPAKAKTIEKFLGKDFLVKSSFGHIRDLAKNQLSVDTEKDFTPNYEISPDKKKLVKELKADAKKAEVIWLATDEDREGEAISWHLLEALELDESKTKRIAFHEITKTAVTSAIENPRTIDKNLVDAQQARRVLDRLVGYELSPLLWKKVKPSLSAGRVQSVAVRLIAEREEDIKNFISTSAFRVIADFKIEKDNTLNNVIAELSKRFETKEEAIEFLKKCINAEFKVSDIDTKPTKKSPSPPFTTSTLQQEASRKLGYSVAKTMMVAQQLYESGQITYMRTDSLNLSNLALSMAKEEITNLFGDKYVKTRKFTAKTKGAQEAHEAIRPTYMNKHEGKGDASQKRLYDLIWKRTIASQMSEALLEKTNITIDISSAKENFIARGEVIIFDGFLKIYMESTEEINDEELKGVLPPLKINDILNREVITATQKFTRPTPRYSEASLVKKMEELGIGRPSTYAPTISTIQKREYVEKKDNEGQERTFDTVVLEKNDIVENSKTEIVGFVKGRLYPTDIGKLVNDFLLKYFEDVIDYNFTATVEKEFDAIAEGKKEWNKMIKDFYGPFHKKIDKTQDNAAKFSGEKLLGQDPKSGKNIYVKIGRFGPVVQMGEVSDEEKPKFAGLKKEQSLDTITIDNALELFKFPRELGNFENELMTVAIGRFGPYIKHSGSFFSLAKTDDPLTINEARAIEIIEEKRAKQIENTIKEYAENPDLKVLNGRWGPYISYKKKNYKIAKSKDPAELTVEECMKIIEDGKKAKPKKRK
ncbi:MAG: type I DNA topoisomerase [Saprospiraceae bacterium]|nr:type I DNA topoisomerase [Saprospiraceae bacterium]